jgi:hypothetical protein
VHGTHELEDGCMLDFGTRAVEVVGTLKSAVAGGSFVVHSGPFTIDGGALHAHGPSGSKAGIITIVAAGPFVMDPSGPVIEADGANGGGIVSVVATAIELRAGTITADGTAGAASGGAVLLKATGPGPLIIDATLSVQGRGAADSGGGIINVSGGSIVVRSTLNSAGGSDDGGPIDLPQRPAISRSRPTASARARGSDESGGPAAASTRRRWIDPRHESGRSEGPGRTGRE